jgi:glutamate 5-kinase
MELNHSIKEKIQSSKTIVIKVGSARVSGDSRSINDFLYRLAGEIRWLRDLGKNCILVSSGAIAHGKKLYQDSVDSNLPSTLGLSDKQAFAAMGQNKLMNLYESFFSLVNIPIAQILFGKGDLKTDSGYQNLRNTFQKLLDWNILPIVNENDSIATDEINLGDNDFLSAIVAALIGADLLVILTGVDGFLVNGEVIPLVGKIDDEVLKHATGPSGPGTGGMLTKLRAGKILQSFGIPTAICNGNDSTILRRLFSGNLPGTMVLPETRSEKIEPTPEKLKRYFP